MKTIDKREMKKKRKEKKKKKQRQKEARGAEAIVKGWELNGFVKQRELYESKHVRLVILFAMLLNPSLKG